MTPVFVGVVIEEKEEPKPEKRKKIVFVPDPKVEPLKVQKLYMSPQGYFKISFTKPILPLPIEDPKKTDSKRQL